MVEKNLKPEEVYISYEFADMQRYKISRQYDNEWPITQEDRKHQVTEYQKTKKITKSQKTERDLSVDVSFWLILCKLKMMQKNEVHSRICHDSAPKKLWCSIVTPLAPP